jgi:4,5-dihydroxyphthalate decarboxylase
MANLPLTLACWDYDRTRPLIDGRVKAPGIDLDIKVTRPRQIFPRMLENLEFQVSELSLASFVGLIARRRCPFVGLPVALSKIFRHSCIYVRLGAGIRTAEDLRGKRIGTTQYGATAVVFMRGMVQHDFGVRPQDVHWFMGGLDTPAQRPLIPLDLPPDIRLDYLTGEATLEAMLETGDLDALFSVYIPTMFRNGSPSIARLWPNFKAVETAYFRRTGIFPVMHIVAIREDVHREHPWVAARLYRAFCAARDLAVGGLYDSDALHLSLPFLLDHVEEAWQVFGRDFWSYGLEPNRPAFGAIGRYVHEQGLAPRPVTADEMFVPGVERAQRGSGENK